MLLTFNFLFQLFIDYTWKYNYISYIDLVSLNLAELLGSVGFGGKFLWIFYMQNHVFVNKDNFILFKLCLSQSSWLLFLFLPNGKKSYPVLTSTSDGRHSYLVSDLRGKVLRISSSTGVLGIGFHRGLLSDRRFFPIPNMPRGFIMKWCWSLSNSFLGSAEKFIGFLSFIFLMGWVTLFSHFNGLCICDKRHLAMICYPFSILMDSIC